MDLFTTKTNCKIVPRDYQSENTEECFRIWKDQRGALTRSFTGSGKTPMACLIIADWLSKGSEYRCMVISYETQLVWQFAQEIEDFVGVTPGIEMEKESAKPTDRVVVACRASLLQAKLPDQNLIDELASLGIKDIGACDARSCKKIIRQIKKGCDADLIRDQIAEFNARPEVANGIYSRVHKFDWRHNWLIIFDEAHRHVHTLLSVGHIVDWFDQNPISRRLGLTATPKRSDGISIGNRMFPGIALDYPLFSLAKRCGVKDGWAVPYVQKYIEVEGVDFKNIRKVGKDFDPDELERILGAEGMLAKLVEPMLDMADKRRTLIFSPGVEMAKNVALYINARVPCLCECGKRKWYPRPLVGDGAACPSCSKLIEPSWIVDDFPQAEAIWGAFCTSDRKKIYREHQSGKFQFLSVCGLCREGYNDPDIACVAVFRPVSKKASSLAEQMKGRACRPARSVVKMLNETSDPEERVRLIGESEKPNALIIDLVGITGLADCASTVQIYCDGLPDEVQEIAEKILADRGIEEEADVEEAIEEAKKVVEEEREKARQEREEQKKREQEEFERRSKAHAEVTYTAHDIGHGSNHDSNGATDRQYKFLEFLGMVLHGVVVSKKKVGEMIGMLRLRKPFEEVARSAYLNDGQWSVKGPTIGQRKLMNWKRLDSGKSRSPYDASLMIDARMNPDQFVEKRLTELSKVKNDDGITAVALDVLFVRGILPQEKYWKLVQAGKDKRAEGKGDAWEP